MGRLTRREFLGSAATAAGALACGLHRSPDQTPRWPESRPLRCVFYTDVHARPDGDTPRALALAASAINDRNPDLVLAGGDLIADGFEVSSAAAAPQWDAYMEMHRAIRAKVHPVLGNHDLVAAAPSDGTAPSADPRDVFRRRLGLERTYYAFDSGGYRFFVLDSVHLLGDGDPYEGRISEEQIGWIRQELAGLAKETPLVLATHIPLRTAFYQATQGATVPAPRDRVVVNSKEVLDLFADHRLILVLQGHLHVNEALVWGGTTFITGGAISGRWWRGTWHGTKEGFVAVTLDGGRAAWEYVDYGWHAG